jgi:protein TonB
MLRFASAATLLLPAIALSCAAAAQPRAATAPQATRSLPSLVSLDMDYPAAALRAGEQGIVRFRLVIGQDGRVTGCAITESSGSAILDSSTCRLMVRRARFTPARDAEGRPVEGEIESGIAWKLSDPAPEPTKE